MKNNHRYSMLTTKEIEPKGWILEQLKIQAKGLCGNLHKVWPDVRDSQWIGGDKEGWERVPYWLDGFIPMAYLLGDEELIAVAKKYVDFILSKQEDDPSVPYHDGWICPCGSQLEFDTFDEWAVLLICKALIVYYDCSGDERIPNVIYRILKNLKFRLEHTALKSWGQFRWYEGLIAIYWMYDRTGEEWLIELCRLLEFEGADFHKIFYRWRDKEAHDRPNVWRLHTHVVTLQWLLSLRLWLQDSLHTRAERSTPTSLRRRCSIPYINTTAHPRAISRVTSVLAETIPPEAPSSAALWRLCIPTSGSTPSPVRKNG